MNWPAAVLALNAIVQFPVLLPRHVPSDFKPLYAIAEVKRANYYSVDLAAVPDCNGAHVCSYAHVIGSAHPMSLGYTPSTCAAYCNDATLTWRAGGAYYEITLKAGTLAQLRAMQRSMHLIK